MDKIIQKIMDTITIVCPVIIAVLGIWGLTGSELVLGIEQVLMIVLGGISAIASIIYNLLQKQKK